MCTTFLGQLPVVLLQAASGYSEPSSLINNLLMLILLLLIVVVIARFIGKLRQPFITDHKYALFELTQLSALDFYEKVEHALEELKVPELKWSRISHSETGGMLGAQREYLRLMYKGLGYTICGAPFGTSFFISWREDEPGLTNAKAAGAIPYVGKYLVYLFQKTRYRIDSEIMYRETVQGVMKHLVEQFGNEKSTRGMPELQVKPAYRREGV